jgi:mono/diheme cytochrome c family protein
VAKTLAVLCPAAPTRQWRKPLLATTTRHLRVGDAEATNLERVVAQVRNGWGGIPPFRDALSAQQINDVSAYVVERIAR